jgi:hypothetical protein
MTPQMPRWPTAEPSCPNCGARATARAHTCADCGYRFLKDSHPAPRMSGPIGASRRRVQAAALTAAAVAVVGSVAVLVTRNSQEASDARLDPRGAAPRASTSVDVLAGHPLSTRAAERRLEARFTSPRDDASASARCSALRARPTVAVRRCRIRYSSGTVRTVALLTNPRGQQLLIEP